VITSYFAEAMGVLTAAFPNAPVGRETVLVYADMLGDIPEDLLRKAVRRCINTTKFFPTIAEIREAANSIRREAAMEESNRKLLARLSAQRREELAGPGIRLVPEKSDRRGGGPRLINPAAALSDIRPESIVESEKRAGAEDGDDA
jgi:hypothetical protein